MEGDRVVWHLGDRLEVDGQEVALIEHRSTHHYPRLPQLDVERTVEPLSDAEGREILTAVEAMGWATSLDPLHLLGWAVLANVGGALEKRPALQITSRFGSGKTFTRERVLQPLLAGLAISRSNSTDAGIRQLLKADTLPVLIDESEGEDQSRREGHLRLARLSYDGSPTDRGTTHGQALSYAIRSSVAMVGINATINNPAERSRTVLVGREQVPQAEWAPVDRRLQELLTPETGARLLRRAVNHLPTLRANVATFRRAVEAQLGGGAAARAGDTYGALLAGAHLLVSTAAVDDTEAVQWLDSIGWSATAALGEPGSDDQDGTAESRQCLAHLLSHEETWRADDTGTGRLSIRELLELARTPSGADDAEEARKALGRRGIRATDSGLEVANRAEALAPIYGKTKWRDGGHRARLLDLPGAYSAGMVRFPVLGTHRASKVPWELLV
jgi:putative DNA primase/helicase